MYKDISINYNSGFTHYTDVKQVSGDVNAYRIVYHTPWDLTGCTVKVTAKRADGVVITDIGEVDGTKALYVIKSNMYSVAGEVTLRMTICSADESVLTVCEIIAEALPGMGDGISGTNEKTILDKLLIEQAKITKKADEIDEKIQEHKASEVLDHPDGSVTTEKIADEAITDSKLSQTLQDVISGKLNYKILVSASEVWANKAPIAFAHNVPLPNKGPGVPFKNAVIFTFDERYQLILSYDDKKTYVRDSNFETETGFNEVKISTDKLADEVMAELNKIPILENSVSELKSNLNDIKPEQINKSEAFTKTNITDSCVIKNDTTLSGTNSNGSAIVFGSKSNNKVYEISSAGLDGKLEYKLYTNAGGLSLAITDSNGINKSIAFASTLKNWANGISKPSWVNVTGEYSESTENYITIDISALKTAVNDGEDVNIYISVLSDYDGTIQNLVSKTYQYSDFKWLEKIKYGDIDADAVGSEQLVPKSVDYSKLADDVVTKLLVFNGRIVFPDTMILPAGKQIDIHYANVFRFVDPNKYNFVSMSDGVSYDGFRRYAYDDDRADFTAAITAGIESENKASVSRESRVKVKIAKTTDSAADKKVLFIGDSITSQGAYIGKLKEMLPEITLLGTRQTTGNHNAAGENLQYSGFACEGRGGWAAYNYCNSTEQSGVSGNPFLNNDTFDFNFYMENQGYAGVDFVFINLGTNDPVRGDKTIEQMLSCYTQMINSIHNFDRNIKVMLWLPPARALASNSNHSNISNSLNVNEALIYEFDNRQNENIILVPVYACIDPYRDYIRSTVSISQYNSDTITVVNDTIHPALSGHMKIADLMYGYIKYYSVH